MKMHETEERFQCIKMYLEKRKQNKFIIDKPIIDECINRFFSYDYVTDSKNNPIYDPIEKEKEVYRLKKNLMKSSVELLVKKGLLIKQKQGKNNEYFLPSEVITQSYKPDINTLLCDIENEDPKPIGDYHTFHNARIIAQQKYNISHSEFDSMFKSKIQNEYWNFNLGQGISSGLTMSDNLNIKVAMYDTPFYYYSLNENYKKKICKKD